MLNVGIIGLGKSGTIHASRDWGTAFRVTEIFDLNSDATVRPQFRGFKVCGSLDEIINSAETDIIVVSTPPDSHRDIAIAVLRTGKHVVIEKPTSLSLTDTNEIIKCAQTEKRIALTHFNRRWDEDYELVKQYIAQQKLGRIHRIESRVSDEYDGSGQYPGRRQWKLNEHSGGILLDWAPHLLDQLFSLFPSVEPKGIFCFSARPNQNVITGIEEEFILHIFYDDLHGILTATWNSMLQTPRWYIVGTNGALKVDSDEKNISLMMKHREENYVRILEESKEHRSPLGSWEMFQNYLAICLENRISVSNEYIQMRRVSHAIDLAKKSIVSGRIESWEL